jgi:hypothetical protein
MSRSVRRTASTWPAAVAGAAAAVLLTGCGGGDSTAESSSATSGTGTDAAGSDPAGSDPAGTTAAAGAAEFCDQAAGIDDRVDSALSDAEGDDPSVADAFSQIATELRAIEAPAAITADWQAMAGGLDRMAEAFAGLDITDSASLDALDAAQGDLSTASSNVQDYLHDQCGIDP